MEVVSGSGSASGASLFKKVLIANRGEIAVRIIRACRDLDISPVVIYSEADRAALHVRLAGEAYEIGPGPSSESYLVIDKIIDVARKARCQAVHPGYGFLAENQEFAQACDDSELIFIGPSVPAMRIMGDKVASREAVRKAGVEVIPGSEDEVRSHQEAVSRAAEIGYPVMVKASAGGGGKGLRKVSDEGDLRLAYQMARGEAQSSFNDPRVFLEKYLERPRHVEIQLLGDLDGHLIHLGERECSIQRRHQKLVEECPSPLVDPELRDRLGRAAVAAGNAVGYHNAGTVEFLIDSNLNFYFLEMNTRLQVEHPVTEMVTGIDLVREQIRIAAGQKLRYQQEDLQIRGHAIECRIYAEDPNNSFFPSPGKIVRLSEPSGPGIRIDGGVYAGCTIPVHYDPLISKLVAHAEDRGQAIRRIQRALREYQIAGVQTTIPFFEVLLSHPQFVRGDLHTHFIEEYRLVEQMSELPIQEVPLIAAALHYVSQAQSGSPASRRPLNAWRDYGRFRTLPLKWKGQP